MADIFQSENEIYEIDVPKEKRYLNTMSYALYTSPWLARCYEMGQA